MGQNSQKTWNILEILNGMNEKSRSRNVLVFFLICWCLNCLKMLNYVEEVKGIKRKNKTKQKKKVHSGTKAHLLHLPREKTKHTGWVPPAQSWESQVAQKTPLAPQLELLSVLSWRSRVCTHLVRSAVPAWSPSELAAENSTERKFPAFQLSVLCNSRQHGIHFNMNVIATICYLFICLYVLPLFFLCCFMSKFYLIWFDLIW